MITLPEFEKTFDFENNFYLSCDNTRIGKMLAHYEFYKMSSQIAGAVVECGILKGCSLIRFATFRNLFNDASTKKIIGFDSFGEFPKSHFESDEVWRQQHIDTCGKESISQQQLWEVLQHKGIDQNIELVEGDITKTLPKYVQENPGLKISLLNLDVDMYDPSIVILEHFYPKIVKGGVLILDDYGLFPGETKAVDKFFKDKKVNILELPFSKTPKYIIKE